MLCLLGGKIGRILLSDGWGLGGSWLGCLRRCAKGGLNATDEVLSADARGDIFP